MLVILILTNFTSRTVGRKATLCAQCTLWSGRGRGKRSSRSKRWGRCWTSTRSGWKLDSRAPSSKTPTLPSSRLTPLPASSPPPSLVGAFTSLVQRGCAMSWCWCPTPLLVHKLVLGAGEVWYSRVQCDRCPAPRGACRSFAGVMFWAACSDRWWTHCCSGGRRLPVQMSAACPPHTQPRPLKLFFPHFIYF